VLADTGSCEDSIRVLAARVNGHIRMRCTYGRSRFQLISIARRPFSIVVRDARLRDDVGDVASVTQIALKYYRMQTVVRAVLRVRRNRLVIRHNVFDLDRALLTL
jgi:hypothetical protein